MQQQQSSDTVSPLVDHLFRHETGKLIAVLTGIFGPHNLELAEDVVQDSLLEAITVWNYKGIPDNPAGWLYKVAKNKALNVMNREKYKREYTSEVAHFLRSEWTANAALDNLFSETSLQDDQLRMMFTCCHPAISGDSQVSLILKTLCGFSIPEIARAYLTTEENVNKRLVRARQKIREDKIAFEIPEGHAIESRLEAVLQAIYLLFNEGYSASTGNDLIRYELCAEAIRLAEIIIASPSIKEKANVYACLALIYLNASRFRARQSDKGEILTMAKQDRNLWDRQLMQQGFLYLDKATTGQTLSIYHILAAISAYHCSAKDFDSTDWKGILSLYDKLAEADPSPLVQLNRTIALGKVYGADAAISELEKIRMHASLKNYHLLYSTLGEFYEQAGRIDDAKRSYETAIELSNLPAEKELLKRKLAACERT